MILRAYRATVRPEKIAAYEAFERDEGVPMVLAMKGCRGAGFGRVREESANVFVFVSIWDSQADLDAARASPTWTTVAGRLETLGFTLGKDRSEHVDLRVWGVPEGSGKR